MEMPHTPRGVDICTTNDKCPAALEWRSVDTASSTSLLQHTTAAAL